MRETYDPTWPLLTELRQKTHRQQAAILYRSTAKRYPQASIPEESQEAFISDWARMIADVGTARFMLGLYQAIKSTSFFPLTADISKHLPGPDVAQWQPSAEDNRRRNSGERSYGEGDVLALWKMFQVLRHELGRELTEDEQYQLIRSLDGRKRELMEKKNAKPAEVPSQTVEQSDVSEHRKHTA